jgi:hypothetical protein
MDEGIRFVIRLKDGESLAALCREFQISNKTGYKILERFPSVRLQLLLTCAPRHNIARSVNGTHSRSPQHTFQTGILRRDFRDL